MPKLRGQGAIEYLLLIGAVLLIVIVTIVILRWGLILPVNQQLTQLGNTLGGVVNAESALSQVLGPAISGISVTVDVTNATVTWNTENEGNSTVEYGQIPGVYTGTVSDPSQATSHSEFIAGLSPETTYYFQVKSCNNYGCSTSEEQNFTTAPNPGPPSISNVSASPTSGNATVTWNTDASSNSTVEYGLSPGSYVASVSDPALVYAHSLLLPGLSPSTRYYYRVGSCSAYGCNFSGDMNFTTLAPPTPEGFNGTGYNFSLSLSLLSPNSMLGSEQIDGGFYFGNFIGGVQLQEPDSGMMEGPACSNLVFGREFEGTGQDIGWGTSGIDPITGEPTINVTTEPAVYLDRTPNSDAMISVFWPSLTKSFIIEANITALNPNAFRVRAYAINGTWLGSPWGLGALNDYLPISRRVDWDLRWYWFNMWGNSVSAYKPYKLIWRIIPPDKQVFTIMDGVTELMVYYRVLPLPSSGIVGLLIEGTEDPTSDLKVSSARVIRC